MSMNKYMHPRNIYKKPPDFLQLALKYNEFTKYVSYDIRNIASINFKDVNALQALARVLLKDDFDLTVNIPTNKLIPTIPLRVNYILWVEDLLSIVQCNDVIKGIDIGTGASCIYPLICAKKYKWHMLATEKDKESLEIAQENVVTNNLTDLIQVIDSKHDSLLLDILASSKERYDFCMCNPPFFSSTQELHSSYKARKLSRPRPKNAFCASVNEVVAKGGEVEFVSKIIRESKTLSDKIKIYTSMVGHKSSLPALKALLKELDVISFKQTEFCQGNTTRWGLAWTFCDIDLRKVPQNTLIAARNAKKNAETLIHVFKNEQKISSSEIVCKLNSLFLELKMYSSHHQFKNYVKFEIEAYANTWTHQRRKRREQKRLEASLQEEKIVSITEANNKEVKNDTDIQAINLNVNSSHNEEGKNDGDIQAINLNKLNINSPPSNKRVLEDDNDIEFYKKVKTNNNNNNSLDFHLQFELELRVHETEFTLEFILVSKNGKDHLHQLLQYIKNNLKL